MEEHEDVLETDNTEAACGEKKHNVTSLAVPPCDIVSAGAPAVWRSLFATHSREYCVGRIVGCVCFATHWNIALGGEEKYGGAGGPQTSELWLGASLSGGIVI